MLQHPSDHGVLVPEGDKDSDRPLRGSLEGCGRRPGKTRAAGGEPNQSYEEVIQTADQDPNRHRHEERGDPVIEPLEGKGRKYRSARQRTEFSIIL
jgi:hypothetical protein